MSPKNVTPKIKGKKEEGETKYFNTIRGWRIEETDEVKEENDLPF